MYCLLDNPFSFIMGRIFTRIEFMYIGYTLSTFIVFAYLSDDFSCQGCSKLSNTISGLANRTALQIKHSSVYWFYFYALRLTALVLLILHCEKLRTYWYCLLFVSLLTWLYHIIRLTLLQAFLFKKYHFGIVHNLYIK